MLHIALFTWHDHVTPDEVAEITVALRALPEQIEALQRYEVGADLGLNPGTADFAVVAQVADEAGLRAYAEHPAHTAVTDRMKDMIAQRTAAQIEP
jgi:phage terminase large subunit